MMYGYGLNGGWYGHTFFGGFFMIIIWVALILFVVWMAREMADSGKKHRDSGRNEGTALDILKERYAKGELTKEQFEAMKKEIMHS